MKVALQKVKELTDLDRGVSMKHCKENMTLMVNTYNVVTGYECQVCKKKKMIIPIDRKNWHACLDNIVIHTDKQSCRNVCNPNGTRKNKYGLQCICL